MVSWDIKKGTALSAKEVYEILRMRNGVFTAEQSCVDQDADNLDLIDNAYHVIGYVEDNEEPVAYARLVFDKDESVRLGRLLVIKEYRKTGLGKALLDKVLSTVEELKPQYHTNLIVIHSQFYLREWYAKYGFEIVGDAFEEGRIMHVKMEKKL